MIIRSSWAPNHANLWVPNRVWWEIRVTYVAILCLLFSVSSSLVKHGIERRSNEVIIKIDVASQDFQNPPTITWLIWHLHNHIFSISLIELVWNRIMRIIYTNCLLRIQILDLLSHPQAWIHLQFLPQIWIPFFTYSVSHVRRTPPCFESVRWPCGLWPLRTCHPSCRFKLCPLLLLSTCLPSPLITSVHHVTGQPHHHSFVVFFSPSYSNTIWVLAKHL